MASFGSTRDRMSTDLLRVVATQHPDWLRGSERLPSVGEVVQCAEGMAQVVRILGKTGDGSRLLELSIAGVRQPFFAAASNVLIAPLAPAM